jgi:hypothetical protein
MEDCVYDLNMAFLFSSFSEYELEVHKQSEHWHK